MLYTTYLAKIDMIDNRLPKLIITRFEPSWIHDYLDNYTKIAKILSPKKETLLDYKKDNDWDRYTKRFNEQLKKEPAKSYIKDMVEFIKKDNDIVLLCFEKDYTHCHRSLIGEYVKNKYNIDWREIKY